LAILEENVIPSLPKNLIVVTWYLDSSAGNVNLLTISILCAGRVGCVGIANDLDLSDADFYDAAEDDF
jgi:hypothetical protein